MFLFIPSGRALDDRAEVDDEGEGPKGTPPDASILGTKIFVASLAMLFGATMIAYLVTRLRATTWSGYDVAGMRLGLLISTLLILGCSWLLHRALTAARREDAESTFRLLLGTLGLATLFLANQIHTWSVLLATHGDLRGASNDLSLLTFWAMTVLHALHVLGGYVPLGICVARARKGAYGPGRREYGLANCAIYWHFLDAVWVVMAIALFLG